MKEIKFRAWVIKDKRLRGVKQLRYNDSDTITVNATENSKNWEPLVIGGKNDECILMQFTGLQDKNNKDIYEGDILEINTVYNKSPIKHTGEVKFESATFIFGCDEVTDHYMTFIELFGDWEIEVIGNIYKNTELLD